MSKTNVYITIGLVSLVVVVVVVLVWVKYKTPTSNDPPSATSDRDPTFGEDVTVGMNPIIDDVNIVNASEDPSADAVANKGQLVRYLRLARTHGSDYMNVHLLEAYSDTCSESYLLDKCGFAVGGGLPLMVSSLTYTKTMTGSL
jgi:hypothetical protein